MKTCCNLNTEERRRAAESQPFLEKVSPHSFLNDARESSAERAARGRVL